MVPPHRPTAGAVLVLVAAVATSTDECQGWCDGNADPWPVKCGWAGSSCAACAGCRALSEFAFARWLLLRLPQFSSV